MAVTYLVDDLLTGAKVRANHPDLGGRPIDSEILRMANGALLGVMTGRLMEAVQGELGAELIVPMVIGQSRYPLPSRAAGPKLRYLVLADAKNNRYSVTVASAERFVSQNPGTGGGGVPPSGAYLEGNNVVLIPTPTASGFSLIMGFYQRPSQMVLTSTCDQVASTPAADTITLAASTTHTGTSVLDVVQGRPHFQVWQQDLSCTLATTTATFSAGSLVNRAFIQAGDWVCQANTTCVVPLPVEIQPLLEVRTAMSILRSKNDQSGLLNALKDEAAEMESQLYTYMSNRMEGNTETLGGNPLLDSSGTSGYGTSRF